MKHLAFLIAAMAAMAASAALDIAAVTRDGAVVTSAAKVISAEALSTNATGTAEVKAVRELWGEAEQVVETTSVSTNWTAVYEDGGVVVTNTTDYYPQSWLYWAGTNLVSFTTNAVSTTTAVTNSVPALLLAVTNDIASVTCEGGVGSAVVGDKYLQPGDRLIYTGTASGRVSLILEK